jgi:hypothetical protein
MSCKRAATHDYSPGTKPAQPRLARFSRQGCRNAQVRSAFNATDVCAASHLKTPSARHLRGAWHFPVAAPGASAKTARGTRQHLHALDQSTAANPSYELLSLALLFGHRHTSYSGRGHRFRYSSGKSSFGSSHSASRILSHPRE